MVKLRGNKNLVKYLVEHGADINKEYEYGTTVLFNACRNRNKDLVEYLVEHGADINKENKYGETALLIACGSGNIDLVKYLVEHGVDINKKNKYGEIALFISYRSGNKDLTKFKKNIDSGTGLNLTNNINQLNNIQNSNDKTIIYPNGTTDKINCSGTYYESFKNNKFKLSNVHFAPNIKNNLISTHYI
ncbi:ankyrin repeat-containing domain protein [Neocallimastix sp. 'constans']